MSARPESARLFADALCRMPGGVNSPARAFSQVGGCPVFIERASGCHMYGADGERYIDYVGCWGAAILGHAHPEVVAAVSAAARGGVGFGAPTARESELAEALNRRMPSLERLRLVNSGTEAAMSAIRLARGYTGRDVLVKFRGCYHGHADSLLVKAGSGALGFGAPDSAGVPSALAELSLVAEYNDLDSARALLEARAGRVAAVIVEPVAGNMGCVPPVPGFLDGLRTLCDEHGALLIMDEVMTGFRVAPGGAQALYGVAPDLTVLGKVIGGGLPVGAFGGRADVMAKLAPDGPVYQAGTLSGNPLGVACGLATLRALDAPGLFDRIVGLTRRLTGGLQALADAAGVPFRTQCVGGMFGAFFNDGAPVTRYAQVRASDARRFGRFFQAMLGQGVYLAPSRYEAGFVSAAHGDADIDATLAAADAAFAAL